MSNFDHITSECFYPVLPCDCACHFKGGHSDSFTKNVGIRNQILNSEPFSWIRLKHTFNQLLSTFRLRLMHTELPSLDSLIQILLTRSSKWKLTSEHHVKKNTQGPNVYRHAFIVRFPCDLWSHVRRCATKDLQVLTLRVNNN